MEGEKSSYWPEDTFIPIHMFPEGKKAINETLPIWNFPEDSFLKETNIYRFIVASLTKWIYKDKKKKDLILTRFCNYFWKKTIIDAFEFYKYKVSDDFINFIKERINNIV